MQAVTMAPSPALLTILLVLVSRNNYLSEASPVIQEEFDFEVCNTPACHEAAQMLRDSMDTSVDPCSDFFQYACGGWIATHPIPEERTDYAMTDVIKENLNRRLIDLLTTAANEINIKPIQDAAAFYEGCMDEDAREIAGLDPLKDLLNSVGGWPMIDSEWSDAGYLWQEKVATALRTLGTAVIIKTLASPDSRESSRNILTLDQADFGLGRNELLNLNASERNVEIVEAYRDFIVNIGKLLNPNADETQLIADANDVIQFEAKLAKISRTPEEQADVELSYNKMTVSDADRITENTYFKWEDFLNIVLQDFPGITGKTEIIISEVDYIKNALKIIHNTSSRTVANYIGWILLKEVGGETTKAFRQTEFEYTAILSGVAEPKKLEEGCTESVVGIFGFAVGRLYVDRYFSEESKRDVEAIVEDIRSTFELTLNHNKWMDPDTKSRALEKLRAMINMVGYPEWIKDDQNLTDYYSFMPDMKADEYFASALKAIGAVTGSMLKKWNEPTHKSTEWVSAPPVVNAFYNPTANTITFPAGFFDVPVYKYGRPLPLNYGAIGSFIGHEITHGFDNTGSRFDKEGDMVNWWSEETKEQFDAKSNCFRRQYSSYVEPTTNTNLNGNLTIGDDIADNGGVRNSFLAYTIRVLESQSQEAVTSEQLPGISATPEQLFFLGYAAPYCWHERAVTLPWTIQYSDHTIERFRVIIPLSNSKDFAEAFNCPPGSPMNPQSKCVLW